MAIRDHNRRQPGVSRLLPMAGKTGEYHWDVVCDEEEKLISMDI
jgi:hypothetical protein